MVIRPYASFRPSILDRDLSATVAILRPAVGADARLDLWEPGRRAGRPVPRLSQRQIRAARRLHFRACARRLGRLAALDRRGHAWAHLDGGRRRRADRAGLSHVQVLAGRRIGHRRVLPGNDAATGPMSTGTNKQIGTASVAGAQGDHDIADTRI